MTGQHILVVETDAFLRQSLCERLQAEGFAVAEAPDAAAGMAAAREIRPDAVLMGTPLPDAEARQACAELRRGGLAGPILILSSAEGEEVAGAREAGATDCIAKPFRMGALLARLRTHLRQYHQADAVVRIGPYSFQPAAKLMTDGRNRKIRLTEKEAAILRYLHQAGRVVARDVLLHEIWGYRPGISTHTLETHIYRLRQKIETAPANARILVTEAGGYRLVS